MNLKHSNLRLAFCCLLATALLPACGGGSSSSSGGGSGTGGNYDAGYAAGTAATLGRILEDLDALQKSLAGSGAPAQTSRGTLGRSFALLEPRQRETLAARLRTLIERFEVAQAAAARPGAGRTEATAAQTAADQALDALRLVVAADTAARAGGGEAARDAAVEALTQIAEVEPTSENAQQAIDAALTKALADAEARVKELEAALAAAGAGGNADVIALQAALVTEQGRVRNLQTTLQSRPVDLVFGADVNPAARYASPAPGVNPTGARAALHQRKVSAAADFTTPSNAENVITVEITAGASPAYNAASTDWSARTAYTRTGAGIDNPDRLEIAPDAVPYASSSGMVIGASLSTAAFPARGTVFRHGGVRRLNNIDSASLYSVNVDVDADPTTNPTTVDSRLQIQGNDADTSAWSNIDAKLLTSFQYMSNGGLTMRFGGTGLIYGDLEYHPATVCTSSQPADCNDITTGDMQISFGAPSADPHGERAYFWNVAFPSERRDLNKADPDTDPVTGFGTVHTDDTPLLNRYQLLLSNSAGGASTAPRYLRYAAYGLFKAIDPEQQSYAARLQTFHYGRDAFTDADNQRPANFNTTSVTASFAGHTMAWLVNATDQILPNPIRMRGDVSLTACLGGGSSGSDCSGGDDFSAEGSRIKGAITNLEYAQSGPGGGWTKHFIPNAYHNGINSNLDTLRLELQASAISATGAYEGVVSAKRGSPLVAAPGYQDGRYEGSLYGPLTRLEAAGTWWINLKNNKDYNTPGPLRSGSRPSPTSSVAIIGSFGACDTSGSACNAPTP